MVELWYAIAAAFLAAYAVLDGFDLGAGALHLLVARTDSDRRSVLGAIGPFWDGNEVFLLASGGVLFVAFPTALAVGLSGFYLAIFLVLWTLLLRGIAIEFRSHVNDPLWRAGWDVVFSVASATLSILFGAALANLIRGIVLRCLGLRQGFGCGALRARRSGRPRLRSRGLAEGDQSDSEKRDCFHFRIQQSYQHPGGPPEGRCRSRLLR